MFIYDHLNATKRLDCNMTLLRNYKRSVLPFVSVYKNTTAVRYFDIDASQIFRVSKINGNSPFKYH